MNWVIFSLAVYALGYAASVAGAIRWFLVPEVRESKRTYPNHPDVAAGEAALLLYLILLGGLIWPAFLIVAPAVCAVLGLGTLVAKAIH